jgi:hypothetical protein
LNRGIDHMLYRAIFAVCVNLTLIAGVSGAPAGQVTNLVGRVSAATPDGEIRRLAKGGAINSGEMVVTGANSYARMKMTDDSQIMLRPNTRFHIEDYNLSEKPEENRSFFSLLKGGFRSVTGLVAKRNRTNYRVRTAVATIGIRGTDYAVRECKNDDCVDVDPVPADGLYLEVAEGGVDLTNEGGTQDFEAGEFGYVLDISSSPEAIAAEIAGPITACPGPCGN